MKKQQGRNKALVFTILVIAAVLLGFIFHLVISGGKSADQDNPSVKWQIEVQHQCRNLHHRV